jgi:hypothetical protein
MLLLLLQISVRAVVGVRLLLALMEHLLLVAMEALVQFQVFQGCLQLMPVGVEVDLLVVLLELAAQVAAEMEKAPQVLEIMGRLTLVVAAVVHQLQAVT